jgi:hypothetical protein
MAARSAGGPVEADDLAGAERLAGLEYDDAERALVLLDIEDQLARYTALRSLPLANDLAPACVFDPRLPGRHYPAEAGPSSFSEPPAYCIFQPLTSGTRTSIWSSSIHSSGHWLRYSSRSLFHASVAA